MRKVGVNLMRYDYLADMMCAWILYYVLCPRFLLIECSAYVDGGLPRCIRGLAIITSKQPQHNVNIIAIAVLEQTARGT
jgi:hypothetical protein